jgi:hypothetical protein
MLPAMEFFAFAVAGSCFFAIGAMIFSAITREKDH